MEAGGRQQYGCAKRRSKLRVVHNALEQMSSGGAQRHITNVNLAEQNLCNFIITIWVQFQVMLCQKLSYPGFSSCLERNIFIPVDWLGAIIKINHGLGITIVRLEPQILVHCNAVPKQAQNISLVPVIIYPGHWSLSSCSPLHHKDQQMMGLWLE